MFGQKASVGGGASVDLLNTAAARFDPETFVGSNPATAWGSRGNLGHAFDLNVPVGTDANLSLLDSGVALLPGASGDGFSTPSTPAVRQTGSIVLFGYIAPFDNTPSQIQTIVAKYQSAGDQRSYRFVVNNSVTGTLFVTLSSNGSFINSGTNNRESTIATGIADGVGYWAFAVINIGVDVKFFTNTSSPSSATVAEAFNAASQLGSTVTFTTIASIFDSAEPFEVGSRDSGTVEPFAGKIARGGIISGADATATPAADFDPSKATDTNSATFTSGGVVWTANGDAFVNASGHTGLYSRGSVGLETTAGQLLTSPVTVYAVFKPTLASPGATQVLIDARSDGSKEMRILTIDTNSNKYRLEQGANINISEAYDNKLRVITAEFLGTASTKLSISGVGSVTGNAGSEDWDFGSILISSGGSASTPGLFLELDVFKGAHSAAQVLEMQNYLGDKYA